MNNNFTTPLDEVDAAARILDPVLAPLREAQDAAGDGTCRLVCLPGKLQSVASRRPNMLTHAHTHKHMHVPVPPSGAS